jgi:hypothetical protein
VIRSTSETDNIHAAADELQGRERSQHGYVTVVDDALGQALSPYLVAAGYEHATIVTMIYSGPEPEPPTHEVRVMSLELLRQALVRDWRVDCPTPPTRWLVSSPIGRHCIPAPRR